VATDDSQVTELLPVAVTADSKIIVKVPVTGVRTTGV
jgi:hypothetical protein